MKLRTIATITGVFSAFLTFFATICPWNFLFGSNLWDEASIGIGIYPLILLVLGGMLGLIGTAIIGNVGRIMMGAAILLVFISPIVYNAEMVDMGYRLKGISFSNVGFFIPFMAALAMFVSTVIHPMDLNWF